MGRVLLLLVLVLVLPGVLVSLAGPHPEQISRGTRPSSPVQASTRIACPVPCPTHNQPLASSLRQRRTRSRPRPRPRSRT
ncbi:hypothetical protein B0H34DRAFT_712035 [Crassisporium funariophilum]|nr:hypothetical protein B0H34DRAFT_712035 [Crassisporium funariophilum]